MRWRFTNDKGVSVVESITIPTQFAMYNSCCNNNLFARVQYLQLFTLVSNQHLPTRLFGSWVWFGEYFCPTRCGWEEARV